MDLGLGSTLLPGDPRLIDHIVGEVKSQGIFDQFRKDALADVDTKPAYQNLRTRVEASVNSFLTSQTWKADLNKNQLRETLRKQISDAAYLDAGVERIVDQVVNPKIYSVFLPQIEDVVYKYLGLEKPKRERNGSCGLKDLLPIDLDPVSPESDKNSLKDVSLDSVDANLVMPDEKCKETEEETEDQINNSMDISDVNNENINNGHAEDAAEKSDKIEKPIRESSTPPLPPQIIEQNLLNDSEKSDDKPEEEEEASPVFEPIDIMNLNESNDSHLSGISELTSHRSRSPDFTNEFSRDHFDFSNQDSQFSKVSSDSHLSIVTDFGSSNPASTPMSDTPKDDNNKDRTIPKDNFKAIRDESDKNKEAKLIIDNKLKENSSGDSKETCNSNVKTLKNILSKESSRDGMDSIVKDKAEQKDKEKNRDFSKSKSLKERSDSKDSRSHRERDKDYKRKSSSSDNKNDSVDKSKTKDKSDNSRDTAEKTRESKDSNSSKSKDEKNKESTGSNESKDLKDIYKEKIRELREKKELTEKEKLNKENKELSKISKESSYKKDSSRDKKEHRSSSSSSRSRSSKYESKSKSSSKDDQSSSRSSSKDKSRRDERRRDSRDSKSKIQTESTEKSEGRRSSKSDKDEKLDGKSSQKSSSSKKESRYDSRSKNVEKSDSKRESESKDKKRRDEKKSKSKDDHPSLRKNSNDRRSSDRDGSNGSNGKGSTEKNNLGPSMSSTTPTASALNKESSNPCSNSSSETSDGVEESLTEECPTTHCDIPHKITVSNATAQNLQYDDDNVNNIKKIDCGQNEISLPLKKRPLHNDDDVAVASSSSSPSNNEIVIKKPKFARNFQEAKKLMKLRKKLEKQKFLAQYDLEKKIQSQDESDETSSSSLTKKDDAEIVPDDERVQIIEVHVDSDDEPYPDDNIENVITSEQRTNIILDGDPLLKSEIAPTKSKLSEMELSIRESLNEMMSDNNLKQSSKPDLEIEISEYNTAMDSKFAKEEISINEKEIKSSQFLKRNSMIRGKVPLDIKFPQSSKQFESSDSEEDCLYFIEDNERLIRFTKFLETLVNDNCSYRNHGNIIPINEQKSDEVQTMAPPILKRKYSTSPLSDIILNNSNNNNDAHEITSVSTTTAALATPFYDDETPTKKKKLGRPKKQRPSVSSSSPQNLTNGDHFVMPLSPDSDVSATSEKMPLQLTRDDKSRPRNNQRYTSDDLYKPRPLFVSTSRRNRRSNQS